MIEARALSRSFGGIAAVREVSFRIAPGTVAAFLGANGAGKTTTMRLLAGLVAPDRGEALIAGVNVRRLPIAARRALGYLPEAAAGFEDLAPGELMMLAAEARGLWGAARDAEIRRLSGELGLAPVLARPLGGLSKGWRQRAWLAQALVGDPPALVLDEPAEGLDPLQCEVLSGLVRAMAPRKAILLSTHDLALVEALATRVIVIAAGRIVADRTPAELAATPGGIRAAFTRLAGKAPPREAGP
jgi:ABC-2 type transport system ATP-binding protein